MNARTYMTLAGFVPLLMAGAMLAVIPGAPRAVLWTGAVCFLASFLVGLAGAVLCVIMLFTKRGLRLGCPYCGASGRVPGGEDGRTLILLCEQCGPCRVRMRAFRPAVVEKLDLPDCSPDAG